MNGKETEPRKIWIVDSTLRDGEQAPGIVFSLSEKLAIAEMLSDMGIPEIEAGIPAMGAREQKEIEEMAARRLRCRLTCWCRAVKEDILAAARLETEGVHISFPVSDILMKAFGKSPDWVLRQMDLLIPLARRYFDFLSIGAQDATRAEEKFLLKFVRHAAALGANRIRIADTVGIARPMQIAALISKLKKNIGETPLEFHAHNDLGMATANTVTACEFGADAVSVTVNGLGERAGNAPLEEVIVSLKQIHPAMVDVDGAQIMPLCAYVSEITKRPIPEDNPITGPMIFHHESGVHCAGLIKNPAAYQPYAPQIIGREKETFVLGRHSGTRVLCSLLKKRDIRLSKDQAACLRDYIRENAFHLKRTFTPDDLPALYDAMTRKTNG